MSLHSQKGRLPTGRTISLLIALVGLIAAVLWSSGYLPLRLREDGLYGGSGPASACGSTIERPKLYLPAVEKKRSGYVAVTRVIDGDTIDIERNGKTERIRLIGIDTDELDDDRVDPDSAGWQATMFVFDLLEPDPQVKLEFDKEREDKYERTLAYAYLPDGRMLNKEVIANGWAKTLSIAPNTKHAKDFAELDAKAREARIGRWK
jgi:micrococcal nuclease